MITIKISEELTKRFPDLALGVLQFSAVVSPSSLEQRDQFMAYYSSLPAKFDNQNRKELAEIKAARQAYKDLGRDPDRYPLSSEALLKRALSGKPMYLVNNLVDLANWISLKSLYPVGLYDIDKIQGNVVFDIGGEHQKYDSLAKGMFDICNLPVFRDDLSGFGSPTSDSKRTCISPQTQNLLLVIISFSGDSDLSSLLAAAKELYTNYTEANNFERKIIRHEHI